MISAQERDCLVAPIGSRQDAEPVLPCPENPYNFLGYKPPCEKFLLYDSDVKCDPYSGIPFVDVANRLGVAIHNTADEQLLAVTQAGEGLIDKIGRSRFPRIMEELKTNITNIIGTLFPPDILAEIIQGNKPAYGDLIRSIISGVNDQHYQEQIEASTSIVGDIADQEHMTCKVSILGSGTQSMVFFADVNGTTFTIKVPSVASIIGLRKHDVIQRIHPAISELLRLEVVREDPTLQKVYKKTGMRMVKPYLATPYMLVEEYCGIAHPSIYNQPTRTSISKFDDATRDYLPPYWVSSDHSSDDPLDRILSGVRNFDIFAMGMGFRINEEDQLEIGWRQKPQFNYQNKEYYNPPVPARPGVTLRDPPFYRTDNIVNCTNDCGSPEMVLVDPFRVFRLKKPKSKPIRPSAPWRTKSSFGRADLFNADVFMKILS